MQAGWFAKRIKRERKWVLEQQTTAGVGWPLTTCWRCNRGELCLKERGEMHYRARGVGLKQRNPLAGALPVGAPLGQTRARQLAASSVHWVQTRSEHWREETSGGGRARYKRLLTSRDLLLSPPQVLDFFHLPLVAPSTSCSRFVWYITGMSLPCSFSFSCMWFFLPCCLSSGISTTIAQILYGTNITWHTHLEKKELKRNRTGCVSLTVYFCTLYHNRVEYLKYICVRKRNAFTK